jgi:hypothetical protein
MAGLLTRPAISRSIANQSLRCQALLAADESRATTTFATDQVAFDVRLPLDPRAGLLPQAMFRTALEDRELGGTESV